MMRIALSTDRSRMPTAMLQWRVAGHGSARGVGRYTMSGVLAILESGCNSHTPAVGRDLHGYAVRSLTYSTRATGCRIVEVADGLHPEGRIPSELPAPDQRRRTE